jgi:hypothetical protein
MHTSSSVWEGLLHDLASSCERSLRSVRAIEDPDLQPHRRDAEFRLEAIERDVADALAADPLLGADAATVATLTAPFEYVRRMLLPFLMHFGPDERYLTNLVARLADEAEMAIPVPIVGTFSARGYWVSPPVATLCLPSGEHGQLLTFPDLAHELAHVLLSQPRSRLKGLFFAKVLGTYTSSLEDVAGEEAFGSRLYNQMDLWFEEFAADAVASYVCGPSFGWQQLRLCAQSQNEDVPPWHPAAPAGDQQPERFTHPADNARTEVIALMMEATGHAASATRLRREWEALCSWAPPPPTIYSKTYGSGLLEEVARLATEWCRQEGLTAFSDCAQDSVAAAVDRAWREQLDDASTFASAQARLVANLRTLVEAQQ